ncbi:diguanylate cyclase [Allopontixanthobacter sp.]|uniref:sensor domain-containing diguanylate cyclase n=1 Tax=Allopontixanthobacter sp. TaxID=2906452 RepID=UPI002ABBFFE7|nr:diguanylate cyclase [Allopontixanthobacter sp.]MDZ4308563.1 diguanylate cyclase [Allopontixanthobacter sp.]
MPALAAADRSQPVCFISAAAGGDLQQQISNRRDWNCSSDHSDLSAPAIILRLPVDSSLHESAETSPRYAVSRTSAFRHLTVMAAGPGGQSRELRYAFNQVIPGLPDQQFAVRLPEIESGTQHIYVAIEGANQRILLDQLHLSTDLPGEAAEDRTVLFLVAALAGMILLPLGFNLAFYRVLREQFLLWHVMLSTCSLAQIMLTSGFYSAFVTLDIIQLRALIILSFGGMMVAATKFAATFIEPDKLSPRLRKLLCAGALWCAFITMIHAFGAGALGRYSSDLFYLGSALMLPVFALVIFSAIRRGSRAVWFQLLGWAPFVIVGIIRIFSYFNTSLPQIDAFEMFYGAIALECGATALGVVDRFMILRRQCDDALAMARQSEALSERDHLTGLMNRRAIEPRFAELRSLGFNTFALIDLDRFKSVNDTHGHALGDEVLQAVAQALDADENVLAIRLGGEEFVLLLRGREARRRAEQRRIAIPARTALVVPGLDRLVTASMGVVEMPDAGLEHVSFNELYSRADKLLYEAKEAGRNRAMFEKLVAFPDRRGERRPGKSVAA